MYYVSVCSALPAYSNQTCVASTQRSQTSACVIDNAAPYGVFSRDLGDWTNTSDPNTGMPPDFKWSWINETHPEIGVQYHMQGEMW